ncbi:hypothetical protein MBAV_004996 [Candidatus Magnetobacterium bavaricum]|uniref:Uncharacterized protein n=1 Tax=Candidatus Magnetobacterium bavaricum TaxID=29290 RepID=A0A0F3GLP6_9BACT|nr:hypothetical protein MBAV_004996 [Candidatus Magnetobacterium bavaricum]
METKQQDTSEVVTLKVEDYLRNLTGEDNLLVKIQTGAASLGLDKMTEDDIEKEILAYRNERKIQIT